MSDIYLPDDVTIPSNTPFAVEVPKKGASCATCRYLGQDGKSCTNTFYRANSTMGAALGRKAKRWCCSMWSD